MRLFTLNVSDDVTLDIHNTVWGTEKVFYNGELMSCKDSFLGATHDFEVEEDGEFVDYRVVFSCGSFRVKIDVFRNNKVILLS